MDVTVGDRPSACAHAGSKGEFDNFTTGFAKEITARGIHANTVRSGVPATVTTT
jgi:hypothetical protein